MLEECGESVPDRFKALAFLTAFAVQFRYEAFHSYGGDLDRPEIIRQVTELVDHVRQMAES